MSRFSKVRRDQFLRFFFVFYNQQSNLSSATCEGLARSSCGCSSYWWANFLYIQNFYPDGDPNNECMGWTWYLANDMQMYWLAPLVLVCLYRFRRVGPLVWSTFLLATLVVPFVLALVYNLSPNPLPGLAGMGSANVRDGTSEHDSFSLVLNKPYGRMGPYLVGMLVAFLYRRGRWERHGLRLSRPLQLAGWLLCGLLFLFTVYGVTGTSGRLLTSDKYASRAGDATWLALSRPLWGLVLAWVTVACLGGFGGVVTRILSARMWLPISRLTFCAYLVHPIVLNTVFNNLRSPIYYQDILGIYFYIGNVVLSYAAAAAVALLVESPLARLEGLVLK